MLSEKKIFSFFKICFAFLLAAFCAPALAAGGLDSATQALDEIKFWLYTFVGTAGLVYLLWSVGMAFAERKSWGEVGMALIYCTLAGGALMGGEWALDMFK